MFATVSILVVSDCQAVASLIHKSTEQRVSYEVTMARFVAQAHFNMVQHITKVKSHCSNEQARGLGQADTPGLATRAARNARSTHTRGSGHNRSFVGSARNATAGPHRGCTHTKSKGRLATSSTTTTSIGYLNSKGLMEQVPLWLRLFPTVQGQRIAQGLPQ